MPTCKYCGDEIEFRHVDGQKTPIHINGGWCTGYNGDNSSARSTRAFGSVVSYVNPNARCPVCRATVYFYQSPFGGRVFFDDLGWPWPKHGCTDNAQAQKGNIQRLSQTLHRAFRTDAGEPLRLFELAEIERDRDVILLALNEIGRPLVVLRLRIPLRVLKDHDVTVKDIERAPSFIVRFYDDHRLIEFISGRKHKIDGLRVPRN
jgi:hypothetical protein